MSHGQKCKSEDEGPKDFLEEDSDVLKTILSRDHICVEVDPEKAFHGIQNVRESVIFGKNEGYKQPGKTAHKLCEHRVI